MSQPNSHPRAVAVVGAGYVGLTTAACLAAEGHQVTCVDVDAAKVDRLRSGQVGILEPGLPDLVATGLRTGRLRFTTDLAAAVTGQVPAEVVFICVPTPMGDGGAANMSVVDGVAADLERLLPRGAVLVLKSTVPVGTAARVRGLIARPDVAVVSNPEFLREGSAIAGFREPDRVVIGADDPAAAEVVAGLYRTTDAPVVLTDNASAEMIKYAANGFLATKLSYVNMLAELCESVGADIVSVTAGLGYDARIGRSHLEPGPGWGGPCLPKDTWALLTFGREQGVALPLIEGALEINTRQHQRVADKVRASLGGSVRGARIGVFGLTFKAGTADLRDSPALAVAEILRDEGAELSLYDPTVRPGAPGLAEDWNVVDDPGLAVKGAAAVVLLTEWPEFRELDWALLAHLMAGDIVIDARNLLDENQLRGHGLTVTGVGRRNR
ncbi:UDP-glucose dehydrogenase family protein [Saccharothrix coeruleofusca]|uniref:UDP-glucose 6-dehydrogenase n=1 Tax=Saccharothrix coeruleofusca TaxID=33919 RepID=A0A918AS40_9PSEU|nr:UDP-glucose/GDP-mannose dehydrogenase family protein [Saccharothrix coeruleofusca]MBP2336005.1 UDPglucose 6-dehydrogenase [Saccharothrix coeruleofusca]GGP76055.1 UDP-glucose 6-dehydrogenase [Saccharothrix coeruleofusca]